MNQSVYTSLQQLVNRIIPLSGFIPETGLFNGKTGISILLFYYAGYTQDDELRDYAKYLINETCDNLAGTAYIDFADGLMGLGWGVNRLIAQKYVDGDSDEILADIDKLLWNETESITVESHLMADAGLYMLARKSTGKNTDLWNRRLSGWLDSIDSLIDRHDIIRQARFLIWVIYCFTVYLKLELFVEKINELLSKLLVHIEFVYNQLSGFSEKYFLYHLCSCMEQSNALSFLREPFPVSLWQPALVDINRFYLYKLVFSELITQTPELFHKKICSIVSDHARMNELLSLLNPENAGLENFASGLAWSLLQYNMENDSF